MAVEKSLQTAKWIQLWRNSSALADPPLAKNTKLSSLWLECLGFFLSIFHDGVQRYAALRGTEYLQGKDDKSIYI